TLQVWRAVKWSTNAASDENLEQLLRDCDLHNKMHARAGTLSGGQKRKLQLAIGLTGGSTCMFLPFCTAGVDPLSRRALWRTLVSFRQKRTIILTTHLLDEADLLADHIAILAAPGKLVASDTPVAMKRGHGAGYTVQVSLEAPAASPGAAALPDLLRQVQSIAPHARTSLDPTGRPLFHLGTSDSGTVSRVLRLLDAEARTYGIVSYDVLGTTIEDIFLGAMANERVAEPEQAESDGPPE
ncbi:P-loop containing nucleoside triphosphate hydrolase protein, partial [Mycena galericulata]